MGLPSTSRAPTSSTSSSRGLEPDWPTPSPTDVDCPVCMVQCRTPAALKKHMERHTKTGSRCCEKCNKCFRSMENFRAHHKACVLGLKEFICTQCNKPFTTQRTLTVHLGDVHAPPGPPEERTCSYCSDLFPRKRLMLSHKTACKKRPYKKDYPCLAGCGSTFSRNRDMLAHLRAQHPEYK